MRGKKRVLSFVLVVSMIMSLFAGQIIRPEKAEATGDDTILLNAFQKSGDGTYYTYPTAEVKIADTSKKFHNLTISVDSGHMKVDNAQIAGTTGQGVVAGDDMNATFGEISTSQKYEAISFEFSAGVGKEEIENYIRKVKFTTANKLQTVSVCAATSTAETLKTTVDGQEIDLKYFNGHYYGLVKDSSATWKMAYKKALNATFKGVKGYLLTITSRAEDRFIQTSFPDGGSLTEAVKGWIGCTRATTVDGTYGNPEAEWNELAPFDTEDVSNNKWRWVCGAENEVGKVFGYQSDACGWSGGTTNDGDFVTEPGWFSNWNNTEYKKEPNGGDLGSQGSNPNATEGYGYYGESNGRWNDNPDTSWAVNAYYIEFGGTTGDDEKFEEQLDQIIVTAEEQAPEIITDGTYEEEGKIPITGKPEVINNDKDNEGNDIVKVGTVLEAGIDGVGPADAKPDSLKYQWYVKENGEWKEISGAVYSKYVVTEDTIDKEVKVGVTGIGKYYGVVLSDPYVTTRTNVDIVVDDPDVTPAPGETPIPDGKRVITVKPTKENTIYAIKDEDGNVLYPETVPATDAVGNALTPKPATDPDYPGYYEVAPDGVIRFIVDKDKTYDVSEVTITSTKQDENIVGPSIPSTDIKTEYDDKDTPGDKTDDKISIIIENAKPDTKYAVLKKEEDGFYTEVSVTQEGTTGVYPYDPSSDTPWTDGTVGADGTIKFTNLDSGTYKVVAVSKDVSNTVKPSDVTGGSKDVTPEASAEPGLNPDTPEAPGNTNTDSNSNTTTPGGSQSTPVPGSNLVLTKAEEDTVTKFVKEHAMDPKGKIVTKITDLTRDIIVSGESDWKKLSSNEKAVVNAKLKAGGSKYTYEQLLKMAKSYKVPGFKVIKFMQKKTKARLKLIKCSGATIVCTSTNSKVATVNKKGVISAKKPGRATLTFTAIKGKYTNRLVIDVRVKKKFKNAKELTKFNSKVIKTPTVLLAKKRLLKKSSKIQVYDLEKSSKVKFTPIKKSVLTVNNKGKYTGKKKGSTLVKVTINQNKKVYLLYVYVTIY